MSEVEMARPGKLAPKAALMAALVLAGAFGLITLFFAVRVDVPADKVLIATRLTGRALPEGQFMALVEGSQGVLLETYNEGFYLFDPYTYSTELTDATIIASGEVGVLVRLFGEDLPGETLIATPPYEEEKGGTVYKGVLEKPLQPGKYNINTRAYRVERYAAVNVPPGYVGVAVNLAGREPTGPAEINRYVNAEEQIRGVFAKPRQPGTYYLNPYTEQLVLVPIRDQRFDFTNNEKEQMEIDFQSSDAFNLTMEGVVQWRIDPEQAPLVVVRLGDFGDFNWGWNQVIGSHSAGSAQSSRARGASAPSDSGREHPRPDRGVPELDMNSIVEKVLSSYIRSFIRILGAKYQASDYISGEKRAEIQSDFASRLTEKCSHFGVQVRNVAITRITPPETIKEIINNRSLQREQRNRITQNIEKLRSDAQLKKREESIRKSQLMVDANTQAEKARIRARQDRNVGMLKVQSELVVAGVNLGKAQTEKDRYVIEQTAKIDQQFRLEAAKIEALRQEIEAAGGGQHYIRRIFVGKMGAGMGDIVTSDDSFFMDVFREVLRAPQSKVAGPENRPESAPEKPAEIKEGEVK